MAEKVFHPDRIIYIDNVPHPIEGSVRPTRMGFECPFLPGDNPQEFFDWAEKQINTWADERAKRVISNQEIPAWRKNEVSHITPPDIAVQKGDPNDILSAIQSAKDLKELSQWKLISTSSDTLRPAYLKRIKELENL